MLTASIKIHKNSFKISFNISKIYAKFNCKLNTKLSFSEEVPFVHIFNGCMPFNRFFYSECKEKLKFMEKGLNSVRFP